VLYQKSAFLAARQKALSHENENCMVDVSASFTDQEEIHMEEPLCSVLSLLLWVQYSLLEFSIWESLKLCRWSCLLPINLHK